MFRLRKSIAILTLLAFVANSATAAFLPCCCVEPKPVPKHECCLRKAADPAEHESSCCAGKNPAKTASERPRATNHDRPCCCLTSPPATPPARQVVVIERHVDLQPAVVAHTVVLADFPPVAERLWQLRPGLLVPCSAPLSALYCVWLK